MKNAPYSDNELLAMIEARRKKMDEMLELKNDLHNIEYEVLQQLVSTRRIDLLKINWSRLEADSRRSPTQ